ncbi:uncharacterized protein [Onthophagus taurus]|uniref:uncharacterized protein n=1 Tax=Onthophagus taurus TaxID=166361 RepID=UPI0039BDA7D7
MIFPREINAALTLIIILIKKGCSQDEDEPKRSVFCRERDRPISTESGDLFELFAVEIAQDVVMQCHYCKQQDNEESKIWYKAKTVDNINQTELKIDTNNNKNLSRIYVDIDHSLKILNITINDSGYYSCFNPEWNENERLFNFYIDVADNSTNIEEGNFTSWAIYTNDYFKPINNLFNNSNGANYVYLRKTLNVMLELMTKFSAWGPCETCGRPQGEGIRKMAGMCAVKISRTNGTFRKVLNETEAIFVKLDKISCKSFLLKELVPMIFNTTSVIPDFEISEQCQGACNPDAEGVYSGWKSTKKTGYKYRKTFVLTENSHLTLVCPESSLENIVSWSQNGRKLPPGESVPPPSPDLEPKITVDTFNTLYLHEVTKEEEGNYTCQVDGVRMQQIMIFVVSKSRLLTQALLRHMMYLGFILSLTISCYISGLIITCTRRHKFKTYRELRIINRKKEIFSDYDEEEGENSDDLKEKGKIKQSTVQVGSVFIQTCCGMRVKNSDKGFQLKSNETSDDDSFTSFSSKKELKTNFDNTKKFVSDSDD